MNISTIIAFISTYLICSINPAIEICKKKTGEDIRKLGSGNAGSANAIRILGKPLGTLVIVLDISKVFLSYLAIFIISKIFKQDISNALRASFILGSVIGHCYPIYYGLRGGKGVIVGMTAAFILEPKSALICIISGVLVILITRTVAMGTLLGTIVYIIMALFNSVANIIPILIATAIIMFKHKNNIKRILTRQEEKLW